HERAGTEFSGRGWSSSRTTTRPAAKSATTPGARSGTHLTVLDLVLDDARTTGARQSAEYGRPCRTAGPFSSHLDDDLARGATPLAGAEGGRGVGERMDRGDHGCEESVKSQPSRPLQVLAVDATLDEASTEIGHGHVTHSDDAAGIPGQRSDRPQRGASSQVDDPVETVRNQPACRGGDV